VKYKELKELVVAAGYRFFDTGAYNLNIVGVRTAGDGCNTFNDFIHVAFKDREGVACCLTFPATTDPGTDYRVNPLNPKGTGIMAPGQHRGLFSLGLHKGQPALVQVKPVNVYRDNNRDAVLDMDATTIENTRGGFNLHRSRKNGTSTVVGKWSAGCQVLASSYDMDIVIALASKAATLYGDSFTYTLLSAGPSNGKKE